MFYVWAEFALAGFSTFLRAERNVRFNSLVLAPSISASPRNSSPAFLTEPFADGNMLLQRNLIYI